MVSVLKEVISTADHGQVTALVLLDLSSAFHCVNHEIMIWVLNERFQVEGQASAWFLSYLGDRSQIFRVDGCQITFRFRSTAVFRKDLALGRWNSSHIPRMWRTRWSVIVSITISSPMTNSCTSRHQLLKSRPLRGDCVADVINLCASRRLQLDVLKTELMYEATSSTAVRR